MNITTLTEEQLKKLSQHQLLELLQHVDRWLLPTPEAQIRKDSVSKQIKVLRLTSSKFNANYKTKFQQYSVIIDVATNLKPVKEKWLIDFINGIDHGFSDHQEDKKKSNTLRRPVFIVIALFISTKYYQEYFIERRIPESDSIETIMNEYIRETVNTRDVIRTLAQQKRMILFDPKQIKKLKLEYLIEQNELAKEFNNQQTDKNNPYPRIFVSGIAYKLFKHWQEQVSGNTHLAEYSFIYRAMIKDRYIFENVRSTEFIDFLNTNFEVTLSEIKTYDLCKGRNKIARYSTAKRLFQL
ncbi:MAG: hypothetical protein A2066_10445 [Bacteroidetes bacterium GWB2_41_8]|nr:MAG: hypothetical protein A2066_10445 [Bacteroidetes bacterium GWB2_41_8]